MSRLSLRSVLVFGGLSPGGPQNICCTEDNGLRDVTRPFVSGVFAEAGPATRENPTQCFDAFALPWATAISQSRREIAPPIGSTAGQSSLRSHSPKETSLTLSSLSLVTFFVCAPPRALSSAHAAKVRCVRQEHVAKLQQVAESGVSKRKLE
ncbi:hypothetical protein JZ751_018847 [Albula glossodonta]|uniref:Uncharacterized protein n=1 Tax=Albula glossodonta TaxID=121402 RepID=A0A8T2N4T0_9TELE|nr:hypothetical protein JZ751_018847 [Albula glossodonta]